MPAKKYLTDASVVPVAIGESTPNHRAYFLGQSKDGRLFVSLYVRKEFIRRWIVRCIEMASAVRQFGDVPSALNHLSQSFSIRDVKADENIIAAYLREKGSLRNTRETSVELARLAVILLRKFDRILRARIPNACGCRIGGTSCHVDFNHLFDELRAFVSSVGMVLDCPVNEFPDFSNSRGRAARLLAGHRVDRTESGKNLADLRRVQKHITCKECATIGDAVIALEQPKSWCLLHIDKDFDVLCAALGRQNLRVLSERAVEKTIAQENEESGQAGS